MSETINLTEAKKLCSASELQLFEASRGKSLQELSAARLKQKIDRTRKLRDKWRDQGTRQRRDQQQDQRGRGDADFNRSHRKAELFQQTLDRFEGRLREVEQQEGAEAGSVGKKSNPPKSVRTAEQRGARAQSKKSLTRKRDELLADQVELGSSKAPVSAEDEKPAAKKPAKPGAGGSENGAAKEPPPKKTAPAGVKAPTPAKGFPVDRMQQREVQAVANQTRQKVSGLTTRVKGHVSGRGKRAQAARNTRKRT